MYGSPLRRSSGAFVVRGDGWMSGREIEGYDERPVPVLVVHGAFGRVVTKGGKTMRLALKGRATASILCLTLAFLGSYGSTAHGQGVAGLHRITGGVSETTLQYRPFTLKAGAEEEIANLQGAGKVTYFYFTDNSGGKLDPALVLKVFWDGASEPSIHVPLADFFGAIGGRTIDYHSAVMQINHLCYMCYLPMPFSRSARFVLGNDSDHDYRQSVAYAVDREADSRYTGEPSRLHAGWKRTNPTGGMHVLLQTRGTGHYVGNFLQVQSRYQGWWGEGDTIVHRDGKTFTHTPGTEDEYGSAWEFGSGTFASPFCGHIENADGRNRMYRWYVVNPIRFRESLRVEVQNQRFDRGQIPSNDDYTSVAFWYLDRNQAVPLDPYAVRVAPSKAASYAK